MDVGIAFFLLGIVAKCVQRAFTAIGAGDERQPVLVSTGAVTSPER